MAKLNDLEQHIMVCWGVVEDTQLLREQLEQTSLEGSELDHIDNLALGIASLYEAKFQKLFDAYTAILREQAGV